MIHYHCSKIGVSPLLKDYNEAKLDSEVIRELYVVKMLPMEEIAKRLKVTRGPILRRIKQMDIKRLPMSRIRRKDFARTIPKLKIKLEIWKAKVFERDEIRCVKCDTEEGRLEAHHIIPVRDIENEELLFDVNNGVTLCIHCHRGITYHEYEYVDFFRELLQKRSSV